MPESTVENPITVPPTAEQAQAMTGLRAAFQNIEETHFKLMQTGAEIAAKVKGVPGIGEAAQFFKGIVDAGTTLRAGYYVDTDGNRVEVPPNDVLGVGTRLYLEAFKHGAMGQAEAAGFVAGPGGPIAKAGAMTEAGAVVGAVKTVAQEEQSDSDQNIFDTVTTALNLVPLTPDAKKILGSIDNFRGIVSAARQIPLVDAWVSQIVSHQNKS